MEVVLAAVARAPPSSMPLFLKTCGGKKKEEGPVLYLEPGYGTSTYTMLFSRLVSALFFHEKIVHQCF